MCDCIARLCTGCCTWCWRRGTLLLRRQYGPRNNNVRASCCWYRSFSRLLLFFVLEIFFLFLLGNSCHHSSEADYSIDIVSLDSYCLHIYVSNMVSVSHLGITFICFKNCLDLFFSLSWFILAKWPKIGLVSCSAILQSLLFCCIVHYLILVSVVDQYMYIPEFSSGYLFPLVRWFQNFSGRTLLLVWSLL